MMSPMAKTATVGHDPFSPTPAITTRATPVRLQNSDGLVGPFSPAPVVTTSATPIKLQNAGGPVVSLPPPVGGSCNRDNPEGSSDNGCVAKKPVAKPGTKQKSNPGKVSYKIPRYTGGRRNQSRSEPSDNNARG